MTTSQLVLIGAAALLIVVVFFLMYLTLGGRKKKQDSIMDSSKLVTEAAERDVERIFNDDFREELRNRGRLHFEKIIGENAMFLQQDLRLTTSQLNEYMQNEIKRVLSEEFSKYEESISTAKDLALEAIQKTQESIEQQRAVLEQQMTQEAAAEKARLLANFEKNMADIVNHYLLAAIGNEIDLTAQLDYIFQYLEENKKDIVEDIRSGT